MIFSRSRCAEMICHEGVVQALPFDRLPFDCINGSKEVTEASCVRCERFRSELPIQPRHYPLPVHAFRCKPGGVRVHPNRPSAWYEYEILNAENGRMYLHFKVSQQITLGYHSFTSWGELVQGFCKHRQAYTVLVTATIERGRGKANNAPVAAAQP